MRVKAGPQLLRFLRWLPALGWMTFIFYLSSQSAPLGGASSDIEASVAHVALYGVLGAALFWAISRPNAPVWLVAWQAFSLSVLYGAFDEVHQGFVPGRTASETDLLLDAFGAALGVLAAVTLAALLRVVTPDTPSSVREDC